MEQIPVEILEKIFKHLSSLCDIQNCFKTCIKWSHIIENMFKENDKVMIVAVKRTRFVEVLDLINPQFRRRFVEPRCSVGNSIKAFGLLGNNPVICGIGKTNNFNDDKDCLVLGNPNIIAPKLLENRYKPSSIVLNNSTIWITGGTEYRQKITEFFSLGQETTKGPELPFTIFSHCMVQVDDQTVYIIGGKQEKEFNSVGKAELKGLRQTWKIDPTNNFAIQPGPDLIEERADHACATMKIKEKIFIVAAGGVNNRSVELLNTSAPEDGWKCGPILPFKLFGSKMITSPTGRGVVLIGGSRSDSYNHHFLELSGDSEESLKWSFMDQKLFSERCGHAAFTVPNHVYDSIIQRQKQKLKEDRETMEANRKRRKLLN